jgi:LysB family phage lysis regulatory protein
MGARFVAYALALLTAGAAALYVRTLRVELAGAAHRLVQAHQDIESRDGVINRLRLDAAHKAKQQHQLDKAAGSIASKLSAVQQENRRLVDENAAFRAWAIAPLPDAVARMQASPAFAGADDYIARMPCGDTLQAACNGTAQ